MPDTPSPTATLLSHLTPDAPQEAPGITIIPLLRTGSPTFNYISMSRAFASDTLKVREVSEGGSVPNLQVENVGEIAALLLDGEEVAGAKQNRMLNTSIMVDARGRLIVPVSCTEAGRWGYDSPDFKDSGYVAPRSVRAPKSESVHRALRLSGAHLADQGMVWDNVENLHYSMGTSSDTRALRDAMEQRRSALDALVERMQPLDGQVGLIAVCSDGFIGMDVLSRPDVYVDLHQKLLRSYVADVLARDATDAVKLDGQVDAFLDRVRKAPIEPFDSPGLGVDHRFEGKGVRGSALVCDQETVHLGAFTTTESPTGGSPATAGRVRRRHWRSR